MFSPDRLGMKDMPVKSGDDFKMGRTRSVSEEILRVQNWRYDLKKIACNLRDKCKTLCFSKKDLYNKECRTTSQKILSQKMI